jgi:hypothetical protein
MAKQVFGANASTGLDLIQDDFLAKAAADLAAGLRTDTLDTNDACKEDNLILALAYVLVKTLRARQINTPANARDRVFGHWIGGESQYAFYRLIEMIDPVYAEFYKAANSVDDAVDDGNVFVAGWGSLGPKAGPVS